MKFKGIMKTTTAGLLVLVLVGVAWMELAHDRFFPKRFGIVEAGQIYRSAQLHPALVDDVLIDNGIRTVVDLQYWEDKPFLLAEKRAIQQLGITQHRFPLNGNGTGDIENYALAIREIHDAVARGEPVLVHCAAGAQRTGGVLAAYRTLVQGKPAALAVDEMELYDWDPVKDRVLLEYLDQNLPTLALRLVELGVIPAVPEQLPQFANQRPRA